MANFAISRGMGTAMVYADDATNTSPKWNHMATTVSGVITDVADGGFIDFALLYTDGELSGSVSEPFKDVSRHRAELARCLTYKAAVIDDQGDTDPDNDVVTSPADCGVYDESYEGSERTDDKGRWSVSGLREGIYRVTMNPRGSFAVFVQDTDATTTGDQQGSKDEDTQLVMLDDGGSSSEEAAAVRIVNTSKSSGTALATTGTVIHLGDAQYAYDGSSTVTQTVDYVVGTVGVAPVADAANADATFEVAIGTQKKTVGKGETATLDLKGTGTDSDDLNDVTITVIAANGYAKSSALAAATITRTPAQTGANIGTSGVTATYSDRNTDGTVNNSATTTTDFTGGAYRVSFPATAVDGSNYKLTINLDTSDSDWASVEYRVGDGSYTEIAIADGAADAATRAVRVSGNISMVAEGASAEITVRVKSQDGKTTNRYLVVVSQASSG